MGGWVGGWVGLVHCTVCAAPLDSPLAPRHTPTPHATRHATRDAGLRDTIYKFVARHRIWFFGAGETCRRATKEDKKHFL